VAAPDHYPYPVMVYVGDVDDDGNPDWESETIVVQIRCGCTDDLRYDYGHVAVVG